MSETHQMRIPPIRHDEWTSQVREILASFAVPFSTLGLNGDEGEKATLSPVLSSVLQHPALAKVFFPFARYILQESTLDKRSSELLVLRVSWLWRSEYEWAQHSTMVVRDGIFTDKDIKRITVGADAEGWNEKDALLIKAVDQLREKANIDDELWRSLSRYFNRQQLIDLVFLVGGYVLVGMYLNAFSVPLKDGMKGFDQPT